MDINFEVFDRTVKDYTSWLDNPYVSGFLIIFLIVYASMAAPRLPDYIANLFDYTAFKLLIFFLILYVSKKNATVALVASVALVVSIMALDKLKFKSEMMASVGGSSVEALSEKVSSEEGKMIVAEAERAEEQGALNEADMEALVIMICQYEAVGKPVLVARTEEGAKRMEEIAKAESEGKLSEQEALRMAASIVVQEAVLKAKMEESKQEAEQESKPVARTRSINAVMPASGNVIPEGSVQEANVKKMEEAVRLAESRSRMEETVSMQELAQEVLKIKQEESARRGGAPISPEELRLMCAGVLNQRNQGGCSSCASGMMNSGNTGYNVVPSDDSSNSEFGSTIDF